MDGAGLTAGLVGVTDGFATGLSTGLTGVTTGLAGASTGFVTGSSLVFSPTEGTGLSLGFSLTTTGLFCFLATTSGSSNVISSTSLIFTTGFCLPSFEVKSNISSIVRHTGFSSFGDVFSSYSTGLTGSGSILFSTGCSDLNSFHGLRRKLMNCLFASSMKSSNDFSSLFIKLSKSSSVCAMDTQGQRNSTVKINPIFFMIVSLNNIG